MKVCIYVLVGIFCAQSLAIACVQTIEMSYYAVEAGGQQQVSLNGSTYTGANGLMVMNTKNPIGELSQYIGNHIWAYCYEKDQYSSFSYATFNVKPLAEAINSDKAQLISQLWALHYDHAWQSDTYIYYGGNQGGFVAGQPANTLENQQALAMSFAIYEIIYDFAGSINSLNLSQGNLIANASGTNPSLAVSIAQTWLSNLILPCDYTGPMAQLVSISNGSLQDVITEIPEPATIAILSLGGLLAMWKRRK
ncbi:MAG TPA: hypothetical protein DDW84_00020 [Phycisphaerales bacterium]|nr:MAG: hypothetical protein A2Y13_03110 [Planctomycetes bacterium GWC2_45_44]HBG77222.1 hypothetical protein [Phycisphaerales bacterium]HBR19217.1 hypothetical protein [Phycisphaerales bacterium]